MNVVVAHERRGSSHKTAQGSAQDRGQDFAEAIHFAILDLGLWKISTSQFCFVSLNAGKNSLIGNLGVFPHLRSAEHDSAQDLAQDIRTRPEHKTLAQGVAQDVAHLVRTRPVLGAQGFLLPNTIVNTFRAYWGRFGIILGSLWDSFGIHSKSFGCHFGILLA